MADLVKIGMLSKGVKYPLTIPLPLKIVNQFTGVNRNFRITGADMEVPTEIRDFLISDHRYQKYFSEEALAESKKNKNAGDAGVNLENLPNVTGKKLTRKPRKNAPKSKGQ